MHITSDHLEFVPPNERGSWDGEPETDNPDSGEELSKRPSYFGYPVGKRESCNIRRIFWINLLVFFGFQRTPTHHLSSSAKFVKARNSK